MDALGLLLLQMEWGADEALDETPVDRFRAPTPAPTADARPRPGIPQPSASQPGALWAGTPRAGTPQVGTSASPARQGTPAERAAQAAGRADSLETLRQAVAAFDGCALRDMATHLVFAAGDPAAGVLLLGGAPGADEDRAGLPFSGREGALLDAMLASVGLRREAMLAAPLIPWRPPGGRVPTSAEIQVCWPFLARLIALTAPRRIVAFGAPATNAVLGGGPRPRRAAWGEATIENQRTAVLSLPALGDLFKTPARRADAWAGMRVLRRALDGTE